MSAHTPGLMEHNAPTRLYDDTRALTVGEDRKVVAFVPADDTMEIENGVIVESLSLEQEANAAEIVRRWNAHEELLAALEAVAGRVYCLNNPSLSGRQSRSARETPSPLTPEQARIIAKALLAFADG